MVKVFIFIFIFFQTILVAQAQNRCNDDIMIFGHPEELPIFDKESPGHEKILVFLSENIKYPKTAVKDKIDGNVFVEFWIDTAGFTHEHKIVKGIREDLNNEALRVAKLIKFDIPAKNLGKPIGICYTLPISFTLSVKSQIGGSVICDEYLECLNSEEAQLMTFWEQPPQLKETSVPVVCELCDILAVNDFCKLIYRITNDPKAIVATLVIDKNGKAIRHVLEFILKLTTIL